MAETLLDSDTFSFADGNGGHSCDLGSAPNVGEWDVLCVNSNTTVSTPSGFTALESAVTNQGAYIFGREAVGGEASTVTITTSGNHNTAVNWSRWSGLAAVDTSTSTQANASAGTETPTHTTGTLAETGELVIAFAALHAIGLANQVETWSSGYTQITEAVQSTGAQAVRGHVATKSNAGTAAEAPQMTWTGDACSNRYMLAVTFTTEETAVNGTGNGVLPTLTGSGTGTETITGTGTGTLPTATGSGAGTETFTGTGAGVLPALEGSGAGVQSQPVSGTGTGTLPALTGSGSGTAPVPGDVGNWYSLSSIIDAARADAEAAARTPPAACPFDGEPLRVGPHGKLFCPADGWQPG